MDNTPERLSLNIVSWNSMAYLPALFESLDEQIIPFRTIVVDNASNDGAPAWLAAERPTVTVLRNMRNQGFARAHNQGISLALSRWKEDDLSTCYIIICNPDTELDAGCLANLQEFMDANPDIDACTPKLRRAYLRMTETEHIKTERSTMLDATGIVFTKSRRSFDRGAGEPDENQYDNDREIFGVSGAFSCFRASSLVRAREGEQFYDEDFFAYQEDVDVAWRMQRLGMKCAYVPQALAWHHRAAPSTKKNNWLAAFLFRRKKPAHVNFLSTRNHSWLLVKHLSLSDFFIHGLWILPYESAKLVASITSWASIKGYFKAMVGLPKMWKKRKNLKQKEKVSAAQIRGAMV